MLWSNRASLPPRDPTQQAGCYWGVSELGKEDGIKGMNTAWKISSALLSLCLLGSELQGSGKEST